MLVLLGNWGSHHSIGLTGLEVLERDMSIILYPNQLSCSCGNRDLSRLINGINMTTESTLMWSIPFVNKEITISIDLNGVKYLSGL